MIASCGEIIAACVLADDLNSAGVPASPFDGIGAGIVTNDVFGRADVVGMDTARVRQALASGRIPVITGFQGRTADCRTATLGRGGSDTSAVVIGGYLGADVVDIYIDVPGVAQIDPHVVPEVKLMETVPAEDMLMLADWGASVIQSKAVVAALRFKVPRLRVRSTFDEGPDTAIVPEGEAHGLVGMALLRDLSPSRIPTGEACAAGRELATRCGGEGGIVTAVCRGVDMPEAARKVGTLEGVASVAFADGVLHAAAASDSLIDVAARMYELLRTL